MRHNYHFVYSCFKLVPCLSNMPRRSKGTRNFVHAIAHYSRRQFCDTSTLNEQENEMDCNTVPDAGTMQELLDLSCEAINTDD